MTPPPGTAVAIGRLAFRVEGPEWVAYWASRQDSMDGAIRLGMIAMSVAANPQVKDAFMSVMKLAFTVAVREAIGQTPQWSEPQPAPEEKRDD